MLHINHTTLSTFFLQEYVIKFPELRSGPVTIRLADSIIHNVIKRVPFVLRNCNFKVLFMKFSQMALPLDS